MGVVFRTKYQIHILEIVMADFSMNTSTASKLFCRICHDEGNLQHPCQCAGTNGLVHLKCLETWFSINGKNNCELCGHLFQVIKKDRSFKEWILTEGSDVSKRYVIFDVIAFILLTPLLIFFFHDVYNWLLSLSRGRKKCGREQPHVLSHFYTITLYSMVISFIHSS